MGEDKNCALWSPPADKKMRIGEEMVEEECRHDICSIGETHCPTNPSKRTAVATNVAADSDNSEELKDLLAHISRNPIILSQVFLHLVPADIKTVALVCRDWRTLVEQPRYWAWAHTRISGRDFIKKFKSKRIRNIGSVQLDVSEVKIRKFFMSVENFRLFKLDVGYVNLASVSADILSEEVVRREEVKFCLCSLSPEQVNAIFSKTAQHEGLRLRNLHINFTDITGVPCEVLSRALVRLASLDLWHCFLSAEQVRAVFRSILDSPRLTLRDLTITTSDFSSLEPSTLSRALLRLESVNLSYTDLTPEQLDSVFSNIVETDKLKMKTVKLLGTNLSAVSAETLSRAVVKLETVDLTKTSLSPDQAEALFRRILETPDLRLRTLLIGCNNLASVDSAVLSQAVVRLKEVKLKDTKLTEDQLSAVFQTLVQSGGEKQRCLHIGSEEFSSVSAETLSQLEEKLAHCHLTNTWCLKG